MAERKQVEAWVQQARADFKASQVSSTDISEAHQRYWLQQAYEKAIKAWGLLTFTPEPGDERAFNVLFLHKHSPFLALDQPDPDVNLPKNLFLLQRQLRAFLPQINGSALLKKLDATTPRTDPDSVSYRYPFVYENEYIAPCDYQDWESYQGNRQGVWSAVGRLLKKVEDEFRLYKHGTS